MKEVVNFKVENEIWEEAQEKAFKKLNASANVDGFRPGKATRSAFEKKYGKEEVLLEAADSLIHEKYHEIIGVGEGQFVPIIEPRVDIVEVTKEKMEVNFVIVTMPEVKLGEYKNLKVKKDKVKVTKEEVDHQIEHLLEHYAELVQKDGKIANGDIAVIDYQGLKDGVAFDGGTSENYTLEIGSHTFIEGFEEGLIGLTAGEEKDLELTFPEDYMSEDLKGQKVIFKVKVNEVKTRIVPELNEEFFEDLALEDVKSKEDLEKKVKEEIKERKEREAEAKFTEDLLNTAVDNSKIELCEELIESEAKASYEHFLDNLAYQGLDEKTYLKYTNSTKEDLIKQMYPNAEKTLKIRFVVDAIIKEENIEVSDEEVDNRINELIEKYNVTKEEVLKEFGDIENVKLDLQFKKVIDLMQEK